MSKYYKWLKKAQYEEVQNMIKTFKYILSAFALIFVLAACNTNEEGMNNNADNMNNGVEDITYDRGNDNGGYGLNMGQRDRDNNRFDVQTETRKFVVPFGGNGDTQYERAERNNRGATPNQGEGNQYAQSPNQEQNNNGTQQQPDTNQQAKESQQSDGFKKKVVDLTNQEREKNGLPKLKAFDELAQVAQKKSQDMINKGYFSHNSPTYGSPFEMMENFGIDYKTAAENIAAGQDSPKEVVRKWMQSAGHRKNILNKNVTHIGIGVAEGGEMGIYWTQMFIQK